MKPTSDIYFLEDENGVSSHAKKCSECEEIKLLSDFRKQATGFLGFSSKCKACLIASEKLRERGSQRASNLKFEYKISLEDYNKIYNEQEGKCAICNLPFELLNIDHCHNTEKIRGLLCRKCNLGLGHFDDSVELLESAIKYLKK